MVRSAACSGGGARTETLARPVREVETGHAGSALGSLARTPTNSPVRSTPSPGLLTGRSPLFIQRLSSPSLLCNEHQAPRRSGRRRPLIRMGPAEEGRLNMRVLSDRSKETQNPAAARSTASGLGRLEQCIEPGGILHLQGRIGNQAVQRMLRPDAREPEAGQARAIQATPAVGPEGWIDLAGEKREQTKRVEGDGKGQPSATSGVHEVLRAPGRPLDPLTRAAMEQRLGHDFSRVRVHTDAAAELSARALNARAYTVGTEMVFGAHEFAPEDREGRGLLTHELTHVVQQRNARIDISAVEPRGSAAECEADAAAFDAAAERATKRPSAGPRGIPRDARWASREIPDVHGMGYNAIYKHAGPDSTGAVLALASLETPRRFVDIEKYKGLEAPVRKSILALEPHAAGTACAGWFDLLRANDPDFKPTLTREQVRAGEAAYHASTREVILQRKVESVKEELPRLGATAIDARWKDIKYGLV